MSFITVSVLLIVISTIFLFTVYFFRQKDSAEAEPEDVDQLPFNVTDSNGWVRQVYEKVVENISDPDYRTEDLASDMNMSRSSLRRKLKEQYGVTPGKYIREVKMRHAKELSEKGGKTVAEIASESGYKHVNNFSKNFEKRFGHRPNSSTKE